MDAPSVWILGLPIVAWAATGVSVAWAFRRSAPTLLLRLSATFLALWSLIATTVAVWLLSNGGWTALVTLSRSPSALLGLFGVTELGVWLEGALGAFGVLLAAFLVNQLVGRSILALADPQALPWPRRLPRPSTPTLLLSGRSGRAEAFSFALLELRRARPRFRRREVILISRPLVRMLEPDELEAVVAHELGHVERLDGRYLTFLRTLSRLVRWDPVLAVLSKALTRREEFYADERAVRLTGRPLALARAICKASGDGPGPAPDSPGLRSGSRRRADLTATARINRLLAMAEGRAQSEALGA